MSLLSGNTVTTAHAVFQLPVFH